MTYFAKFIGGPMMGKTMAMAKPLKIIMVDQSISGEIDLRSCSYVLQSLIGDGEHRFCFYTRWSLSQVKFLARLGNPTRRL